MGAVPVLKATNISKSYGPVNALANVDFVVMPGEVHALMGENGAGKSTLAKLLAGIEQKDEGIIELDGKEVVFNSPADAIRNGIAIVNQELNNLPYLPVYENIILGQKKYFKGNMIFEKKRAISATLDLLALFDMQDHINPLVMVNTLSVAEQQIVEIIKAVAYEARLIILDEPTASLTSSESDKLFELIRQLKSRGCGVVIVSHRFNDIFAVSDKITVLRDGVMTLSGAVMEGITDQSLVKYMVGREIHELFGDKADNSNIKKELALEVENLCGADGYLKNINLKAYTGEILGISGLVGSGRTELIRAVFGADKYESGSVRVFGRPIKNGVCRSAIRAGVAFATENRKAEGLFLGLSVFVNSIFAKMANKRGLIVSNRNYGGDCEKMINMLDIKTYSAENLVNQLSGGNQQKIVLAKWLLTAPKVFILDEPTRGIDVGVKTEIYNQLYKMTSQGICVIVVSSELLEIVGICDRIVVMKSGEIVADIQGKDATEEKLMRYASDGKLDMEVDQ